MSFQEYAPDGSIMWEAYAKFGPQDVHRQVCTTDITNVTGKGQSFLFTLYYSDDVWITDDALRPYLEIII